MFLANGNGIVLHVNRGNDYFTVMPVTDTFSEDQRKTARLLAEYGLTLSQIAVVFRADARTLKKRFGPDLDAGWVKFQTQRVASLLDEFHGHGRSRPSARRPGIGAPSVARPLLKENHHAG